MDLAAHHFVVDNFLADTRPLRAAFDARFGERVPPFDPSRFSWEYWHVPGQFAQHRAPARDVFPADALAAFEARLLAWSRSTLGLGALGGPLWVSFLLHGDYQGLHRDTPNGTFAFTFGLSRPGRARFSGGETLLARPELLDYWRRGGARAETSAEPLFEAIAPRLNRLVAFDARIPHAVRALEGPRDPRDGRVAIQGWVQADGCVVEADARAKDEVDAAVERALGRVAARAVAGAAGLLAVALDVAASGAVRRASVRADTLVRTGDSASAPERARFAVVDRLSEVRLPAARRATSIVVPAQVDGERATIGYLPAARRFAAMRASSSSRVTPSRAAVLWASDVRATPGTKR
jgi:hypothetical protein